MRKLTVVLAETSREEVLRLLDDDRVVSYWAVNADTGRVVVEALIKKGATEDLLDRLEGRFGGVAGFRAIVEQIEVTAPKIEEPEPETPLEQEVEKQAKKKKVQKFGRVSRQELLARVDAALSNRFEFFAMVLLASVVAACGLLSDSTAAVIAAMVLAPLLGPNLALALATTTGDRKMFGRAVRQAGAGFGLALVIAVVLGVVVQLMDRLEVLDNKELTSRSKVSLFDFVLALASGVAGALSFLSGAAGNLIAVMVAVALLPPTLVVGVNLGAGRTEEAWLATLLLAANLICVNFAGVATFAAAGLRPARWWEAERVRRETRRAMVVWGVLLVAFLVVAIYAAGSTQ